MHVQPEVRAVECEPQLSSDLAVCRREVVVLGWVGFNIKKARHKRCGAILVCAAAFALLVGRLDPHVALWRLGALRVRVLATLGTHRRVASRPCASAALPAERRPRVGLTRHSCRAPESQQVTNRRKKVNTRASTWKGRHAEELGLRRHLGWVLLRHNELVIAPHPHLRTEPQPVWSSSRC
eukprot:5008552-Prymnesium_polylepis.1